MPSDPPNDMPDAAFARLVDAHYAGLYRFALSLARSGADASDLTQQTFYIWATKGHALRDLSKAKTWLFTTLYREFLRSRKRDSRVSSIEDLPPADQDPPDPDADAVKGLDAGAVMQALQRLPEIFRAPLTLFYLKNLSYQEIADILGVPIGTVMSRLARAKSHLRAALADDAGAADKLIEFPKAQGQ